ncbi:MAG TPA: hypothetical protein VHF88_07350, partial [Thermoleophilaceae bacterium]|nr:hypothetical protein [Thermoleophilaceae bacterium]
VDELTSDSAAPPTGGGRLGSVASERFGYWNEAFDAFGERPLAGLGAGSFELARLAHRNDGGTARRAHGFVAQTVSDLGLAGAIAALTLLAAWLAAATRATALQPRRWWQAPARARPRWDSERAALVALALAAVVYGVQSALDWTWFVPGLTVSALVAAGFVAGRGPSTAARRPRASAPRLLACAGVVLIAVFCGWAIWQPVAADRATARAYDLIGAGKPLAALRETTRARDLNPYSPQPRYATAVALADLDREQTAIAVLRATAADRPRDPAPWLRIATIELDRRDAPAPALAAAEQALRRDPHSARIVATRDRAAQLLAARQAASAPAPSSP